MSLRRITIIFTTGLKNINKIPKESIKLIISRYLPTNFNILNYENIIICKELSPSKQLIDWYNSTSKEQDDWEDYIIKFMTEVNSRQDMQTAIKKLKKLNDNNIDVYLICYESNCRKCHRSIISRYLKNMYGIEFKEFN